MARVCDQGGPMGLRISPQWSKEVIDIHIQEKLGSPDGLEEYNQNDDSLKY